MLVASNEFRPTRDHRAYSAVAASLGISGRRFCPVSVSAFRVRPRVGFSKRLSVATPVSGAKPRCGWATVDSSLFSAEVAAFAPLRWKHVSFFLRILFRLLVNRPLNYSWDSLGSEAIDPEPPSQWGCIIAWFRKPPMSRRQTNQFPRASDGALLFKNCSNFPRSAAEAILSPSSPASRARVTSLERR